MKSRTLPLCAFGAILLTSAPGIHAQGTRESDLMEARSVKLASTTMGYRLFKPKNYVATQKYPIVVALHGIGERGNDNRAQVDREDLAHPWIEDSIQARVPHFVMLPQCPSALTWSGGTGGNISETGQGILDALDALKKEFSLDENRFYVAGLSLGGAGTYHLLQMKPDFWAAAVPCAAGGDTSKIEIIAKTPFWHHHGSLDGNPPAGRRMAGAMEGRKLKIARFVSQAAITAPSLTSYSSALRSGTKAEDLCFKGMTPGYDSLKKAVESGANHLYLELTGGDHRSGWMIAWHNPLVAKWMFSKVRGGTVSLAPKTLVARRGENRATLVFGALPAIPGDRLFDPRGRALGVRPAASWTPTPLLSIESARR